MLLFVFGFVGGAVVINSAVLVSLSVLLLVHYSVSTGGLPALPSLPSFPRSNRYNHMFISLKKCGLMCHSECQFESILSQFCYHVGVFASVGIRLQTKSRSRERWTKMSEL